MTLPHTLLAQAGLLATKERLRPKQASLRRVISTAYYALFHFLVDKSCRFLVSGSVDPLRSVPRARCRRCVMTNLCPSASTVAGPFRAVNPWSPNV
jgi:hypothetical protein